MLHLIAQTNMDPGTGTAGHRVEHQTAEGQHHQGSRGGSQAACTETGNSIDQILGSHAGNQSHGRTCKAQTRHRKNGKALLIHPLQKPSGFPSDLLGVFSIYFILHGTKKTHRLFLSGAFA